VELEPRHIRLGPLAEIALAVAVLAVAKPVLAPIALAVYLAFVLTPPSDAMERVGIPRPLSVAIMMMAALALFMVVSAVVSSQVVELASRVHTYVASMSTKLATLRGGHGGTLQTLTNALNQLGRVFESTMPKTEKGEAVRIVAGNENSIERLRAVLAPLFEPLTAFFIVVVLTIFVLAQREDLRGRIITLAGPENVTVTTRTLDEAVRRISHLLLGLTYINVAFGALVAAGLWLIGIPYALLWGAMAGVLRFVPIVGSWFALALPTFVAFATTPGWVPTIRVVGLFVIMDLTTANIAEPLLLGKRTGVSSLALLVSIIFWTWIWGPLGLVLATPLTVCVAAVGRQVPRLKFLSVVLSDDPGLPPDLNFYQRVLARDVFDALRIAKRAVLVSSVIAVLDRLVLPALRFLARDLDTHAIGPATFDQALASLGEIVRKLRPARKGAPEGPPKPPVLAVAAEGKGDRFILDALALATINDLVVEPLPAKNREEAASAVVSRKPRVVCIAALPPGSSVTARYLCRRIRRDSPETRIVAILPSAEQSGAAGARTREAGAHAVAFDLAQARKMLRAELGLKD
jgi:predicted PurR-regulated permease PerM